MLTQVPTRAASITDHRSAFVAAASLLPLAALSGSPIIALLLGIAIGLTFDRTPIKQASHVGKIALQSAIVLIGFKLNLASLGTISADYLAWVTAAVAVTLFMGLIAGALLRVDKPLVQLLTTGTAICGGSAMTALMPVIRARAQHLAVALAVVFVLNAVAMIGFPIIGSALDLAQEQFGVWSAIAIHDTASVVATATAYGEEATIVAATVKLGRTLWLIPVLLGFAVLGKREGARIRLPVFIALFLMAAVMNSFVPLPEAVQSVLGSVSSVLLCCALFFVGCECRRSTLHVLEPRTLLFAVGLWVAVASSTLFAVVLWV
ncbi:MAG: YeiH family protein [Gammaproteobacteria bacterium]